MKDIIKIFNRNNKQDEYTATFSLTGQLEAIVRGYIVEGEGGCDPDEWIRIYYSDKADPESTCFASFVTPQNLIAYVSLQRHCAFVLSEMLKKFKEDSKGYGLMYFPFSSFDEVEYFCSNPSGLPNEFKAVQWIDDDFLNDETIPFDFASFEKIDSGIKFLNPNHFSLNQLMDYLYASYRL